MIKYYRKTPPKPIPAIKWDGTNYDEIAEFAGQKPRVLGSGSLGWEAFGASHRMNLGDYIIKDGTIFSCPAYIFNELYEEVKNG